MSEKATGFWSKLLELSGKLMFVSWLLAAFMAKSPLSKNAIQQSADLSAWVTVGWVGLMLIFSTWVYTYAGKEVLEAFFKGLFRVPESK
ncbi:MAG: hypothetical protein AAB863_02895 [Patescibacteria group bacterium]